MEALVEATLAFLSGDADGEEPRPTDLAAILRTLCDEAADRGGTAVTVDADYVDESGPARVRRQAHRLADAQQRPAVARDPGRVGTAHHVVAQRLREAVHVHALQHLEHRAALLVVDDREVDEIGRRDAVFPHRP